MAKDTLIILAPGFEEIEAVTVIDILRRARVEVTVAGLGAIEIKGSRGIVIKADKQLSEDDNYFCACILPGGGQGANNLAASNIVKNILITMNQAGKIIAAICAAPAVVLSPLGLLDNKAATCFPGMEDAFERGTNFKAERVVVDGNMITSRAPGTALEFALTLVEKLMGSQVKDKIAQDTLAR